MEEEQVKYCKPLTKEFLLDAGFRYVYYLPDEGEWCIMRKWYKNKSKTKLELNRVKVTKAIRTKKYGPTKTYDKVQFSYKNKGYAITLARFLYVWFVEDITEPGTVMDHIYNNPKDNNPDHLQPMSIPDNLEKRFKDNPYNAKNQWWYIEMQEKYKRR